MIAIAWVLVGAFCLLPQILDIIGWIGQGLKDLKDLLCPSETTGSKTGSNVNNNK